MPLPEFGVPLALGTSAGLLGLAILAALLAPVLRRGRGWDKETAKDVSLGISFVLLGACLLFLALIIARDPWGCP